MRAGAPGPTRKGPNGLGSSRVRVESSRVQSSLADKSVGQNIASSSATDALKWARDSAATRRPPAPEKALVTGPALASPGRIASLSNQTPPRLTAPRHAARNWLLSLCRYGLRDSYISQGDTPTLHVSAPRHAQHISQSVTTGPCPIIKPKSIPKWKVVAPGGPHLSPSLTNFLSWCETGGEPYSHYSGSAAPVCMCYQLAGEFLAGGAPLNFIAKTRPGPNSVNSNSTIVGCACTRGER